MRHQIWSPVLSALMYAAAIGLVVWTFSAMVEHPPRAYVAGAWRGPVAAKSGSWTLALRVTQDPNGDLHGTWSSADRHGNVSGQAHATGASVNLLDPVVQVAPAYVLTLQTAKGGNTLTGTVVGDTATHTVLTRE